MDNAREKLVELLMQVEDNMCDDCGREPVGCAVVAIADHLLANSVTVQEWIPVTERLPNYFAHVLINTPGDKPFATVHEARLRKDGLWDTGLYRYDKEDVTHWMPLPAPPKKEE